MTRCEWRRRTRCRATCMIKRSFDKLDKLVRINLCVLIMLDVHDFNTVQNKVVAGVESTNDFMWVMEQLERDDENSLSAADVIKVKMVQSSFPIRLRIPGQTRCALPSRR